MLDVWVSFLRHSLGTSRRGTLYIYVYNEKKRRATRKKLEQIITNPKEGKTQKTHTRKKYDDTRKKKKTENEESVMTQVLGNYQYYHF